MKKITLTVYETEEEKIAVAERILHMKEDWLARMKAASANPQLSV